MCHQTHPKQHAVCHCQPCNVSFVLTADQRTVCLCPFQSMFGLPQWSSFSVLLKQNIQERIGTIPHRSWIVLVCQGRVHHNSWEPSFCLGASSWHTGELGHHHHHPCCVVVSREEQNQKCSCDKKLASVRKHFTMCEGHLLLA